MAIQKLGFDILRLFKSLAVVSCLIFLLKVIYHDLIGSLSDLVQLALNELRIGLTVLNTSIKDCLDGVFILDQFLLQ